MGEAVIVFTAPTPLTTAHRGECDITPAPLSCAPRWTAPASIRR